MPRRQAPAPKPFLENLYRMLVAHRVAVGHAGRAADVAQPLAVGQAAPTTTRAFIAPR